MSCHFFGMKMCLESYQHLAATVRLVGKFDTYGFHTVKYLHHSTWKGTNGIMNCMAHTMWSLNMSKCKEVLKKSTYMLQLHRIKRLHILKTASKKSSSDLRWWYDLY